MLLYCSSINLSLERCATCMGKPLNVFLSHSNPDFVKVCSEFLRSYGLNITTIFNDGLLLLNRIISDSPDAVLMEASMITFDAIDVLHAIKKVNGVHPPAFFVLSTECNDGYITKLLESGADYYIPQPFDYDILVDRIALFTKTDINLKASKIALAQNHIRNLTHSNISQILNEAGILSNNIGYSYLKTAIYLAIEDPSQLSPITQKLYLSLARRFNTSPSSVINAMRYAIKISYQNGNTKFWYNTFEGSIPSLSIFLAEVAKMIQNQTT